MNIKSMYFVGVDEVGRGSLAGSVVACATLVRIKNYGINFINPDFRRVDKRLDSGCASFTRMTRSDYIDSRLRGNDKAEILRFIQIDKRQSQLVKIGVRDSKELKPKKREELEPQIKKLVDGYGIGEASVKEINRLGIVRATWTAMKRAVEKLNIKPDLILVDGREIPRLSVTSDQLSVVRGDKIIPLISAAAIIAKVYRDRVMVDVYHRKYPQYGFDKHKGYGTELHQKMIRKSGLIPVHRVLFCRKYG